MCVRIWYLSFSFWLTSLCIIGSRFIHLIRTDSNMFLFMNWNEVKVAQSCLTLWDPMDYTVPGILQARTLEWVAFPFSKRPSQPTDWTQVSHIAGGFFTNWAMRETHSFLWLSNIPLCIYITTSLSIHLLMASRLLPCSSYCKQCYSEQWDTCVFFNPGFLRVYA